MVTLNQIALAALAASFIVLSVKFEIWHRQEQRRIAEYRERLKEQLARSPEDVAYAIERARSDEVRLAAAKIIEESSAAPLAHRLHEVA